MDINIHIDENTNIQEFFDALDRYEQTRNLRSIPPACRHCPNHPVNGGSGICHCIMGSMRFTY